MNTQKEMDVLLEKEDVNQADKKRRNELRVSKPDNQEDPEILPSENQQETFMNPSLSPQCDKESGLNEVEEDKLQETPLKRMKKEEIYVKKEVISPQKNVLENPFHKTITQNPQIIPFNNGNKMKIKPEEAGTDKNEEFTLKQENIGVVSTDSGELKTERPDGGKLPFKKGGKTSVSSKRKKLNTRLSKLLMPKNAVIFLNELNPGCTYNVRTVPGCTVPQFEADVEQGGQILGTGKGFSKSQCKALAAENAVKTVVVNMINDGKLAIKNEVDSEDPGKDLSWAGLASYALFKLFTDWQKEGFKIPLPGITPKEKSEGPGRDSPKPDRTKPLPPNPEELHPTTLLHLMIPGILATELQREHGLVSRVVMGYDIDGKTYVGQGTNKKEAKKKAAEAALSALWGVTYTTGSQ